MDTPTTQTPAVSQSKRRGSGCAFFFCLFFLLIGVLPTLHDLPGLQARFTGMETTAHVTTTGSCSWQEADNNGAPTTVNGYYYVYTYAVSSGKVYQISNPSCGNSDTPGASETIWYDPANPTHFITMNAWTFDWIFFLGFSIPMLLLGFAFFRRLFAPKQRFTSEASQRARR
jgi:hypothetical protein